MISLLIEGIFFIILTAFKLCIALSAMIFHGWVFIWKTGRSTVVFLWKKFTVLVMPILYRFLYRKRQRDESKMKDSCQKPGATEPAKGTDNDSLPQSLKVLTQIVPVKDVGTMTLQTHIQTRVVVRKIGLSAKLKQLLGDKRLLLDDIRIPSNVLRVDLNAFAYQQSLTDLQNKINSLLMGTDFSSEFSAVTESIHADVVAANLVPANNDRNDKAPIQSPLPIEREVRPSDAMSHPSNLIKPTKRLKPKEVSVGRFIRCGTARKTGVTYSQFFVEFYDDAMSGEVNQIWGNDLRRAIDIVQPVPGTRIQITNYGFQDVDLPDGKKTQGRKFSIERL